MGLYSGWGGEGRGDVYLDDGMLFVIANKLDGDLLAYWASLFLPWPVIQQGRDH